MKKRKEFLNYLDGKTWLKYSISIWDIAKTPEELELGHPAMFPTELCRRLIEIYTKFGETVLDPFMGSGSTVVAAKELGRRGIGIDINPEYVNLAKKRVEKITKLKINFQQVQLEAWMPSDEIAVKPTLEALKALTKIGPIEPEIYCADAKELTQFVSPNSVDLCITSPPYWNIHLRERTADYKESRPYSNLPRDLGNIEEYPKFLNELGEIFKSVHTVLKPNKRCIVIVMDIRVQDRFYPYHMDLSRLMQDIGFVLEDTIIWDRRKEYNLLRPLGYPYKFIVNKVHEYILIFQKSESSKHD
jgi:DNA modification methylase